MNARIVIIGAGPTGLGAAYRLSQYAHDDWEIFERDAHVGGLNAPTIGAEIQLPFGGIKQTGNGHREAGSTAIDQFTEWKAIYVDYSGRLQKAQIDTHSQGQRQAGDEDAKGQ